MTPITTNPYIGYFVGALAVIPFGALIAKHLTTWIAGYHTSYSRALISTIAAYLSVNLIGFAFRLGGLHGPSIGLMALMGLAALSCSHLYLLRSKSGEDLSPGKAILVAFGQMLGVIVTFLIVLPIIAALRKHFV
jgi:hypothetical protein